PDTYMRVTTETCVSTARHGAKYLLILNWHEGNIPSLAIAAESLHRDHGMTVLTVQACYVAEELYGHSCNGLTHGGEIEALAVLAYRPQLVHLDRQRFITQHGLLRQSAPRDRRQGRAHAGRHRRLDRQGGGRDLPPARRRPGRRHRRAAPVPEGDVMARLLTTAEAKLLDLPGRRSRELVSGKIGSN